MPPSCPSPWRIPGCSASPTGRTPQERSSVPHHRSGVMSKCSLPTSSVPDQNPVCAKRIVSNSTRPYLRMCWRGSRNASIAPSHVRSQAMPCSRSEEHTSELQSHSDLVCRLLLDTATTQIYTLSLHDALPISPPVGRDVEVLVADLERSRPEPGLREAHRVEQHPAVLADVLARLEERLDRAFPRQVAGDAVLQIGRAHV